MNRTETIQEQQSEMGVKTSFIGLDLETTGTDPQRDRIVEVGAVRFDHGMETACFRALVDPGVPIGPESACIHGITDEMVAGQPRWEHVQQRLARFVGNLPIVAHYAEFDRQFAGLDEKEWLCTWRLARQMWDAPHYGLQYLRYWLRIEVGQDRLAPHTALDDARLAGLLFLREAREFALRRPGATFEDLTRLEQSPLGVNRMPMRGAYAGTYISEVPSEYLKNALADAARPWEFQDLRLDQVTENAIRQELLARGDLPRSAVVA